jgi:hypothetical protein
MRWLEVRVVTSASPRAVETALAMGLAVDDTVELLSGYVPGEVEHHQQWRWPRPHSAYAELLARRRPWTSWGVLQCHSSYSTLAAMVA